MFENRKLWESKQGRVVFALAGNCGLSSEDFSRMSLYQPLESTTQPIFLESDSSELPFHARTVEACLSELNTTLAGLSNESVETRHQTLGKGSHTQTLKAQVPRIFLNHLK